MTRKYIALLLTVVPLTTTAADKQWFGDIDLNMGYNNNIYYQTDELEILTNNIEQNQDIQNQVTLGSYYKFIDHEHSDMKVIADYFRESFSDNEITTSITTISLPYSYYTYANRFRITPILSRYVLDGEVALLSSGANVDFTYKLGRYQWGINYQQLHKNAQTSDYAKYQGASRTLGITYSGRWLNQYFKLSGGAYDNAYNETVDGNESYTGLFTSASYTYRIQHFEIGLYSKVQTKKHTEMLYDNSVREDTAVLASITPSYSLSKNTSVYTSFQWTKNKSNQTTEGDNMNYTQAISSVGFRYAF